MEQHKSVCKPIQLGLCCINTELRNQSPTIFMSRKMTVKSILEKGIERLKELIIQNLHDVLKIMDWNEQNGIKVLRLSSGLFPHKTNPDVPTYSFDFAIPLLREIGTKSKLFGQRLTFHPGQFNVVGTPNPKCLQKTIDELSHHADIFDLMELGNDSVMVVHGGGTYGNKTETKDRWCAQFMMLPENVRRRLVLENCEKNFSIIDCLEISDRINIPVVFDTHHFQCYLQLHPEEEFDAPEDYIEKILETWRVRQIKPKFHVSEQGSGKCGHHSDYIEQIPQYLLDIPDKYGVNIDIMIEAKCKEQSIMRLYQKYPRMNCLRNTNTTKNTKNKPKKRVKLICSVIEEI